METLFFSAILLTTYTKAHIRNEIINAVQAVGVGCTQPDGREDVPREYLTMVDAIRHSL